MSDLAQAYVQIIPTTKGIKGSISSALNGEASAAGTSAGQAAGLNIGSMIKSAIMAAGIGTAIKAAVSEGMELQQNLGGTEAVFGEFANNIQNSAKTAYKNMGISASEYMATANKMGSLFQGSGLEQQKALELTTNAMQRAADVASVMGIDTQWAMESIAGAAKGNFTMMDNLGVAMNATTIQAYALEKGINFDWNTADNAQKAEVAMQMFMERTSQYAGNFAKEADGTMSGAIGSVKAAAQDLMGALALGQDVTEPLNNLVVSFAAAAENLLPAIGNIITAGIPAILDGIMQLMPMLMSRIPEMIQGGSEMIQTVLISLGEKLPELLSQFAALIPAALQSAFEALPGILEAGVSFINTLASGLAQGIPTFLENVVPLITDFSASLSENAGMLIDAGINLILQLAQGLINGLPVLIQNLPTIIDNVVIAIMENLPKILEAGVQLIFMLWQGIIEAVPTLIAEFPMICKTIIDTIKGVDWLAVGKNLIETIKNGIIMLKTTIPTVIKQIGETAVQWFKSIDWIGLGKNIIDGIVNGLKSAAQAFYNFILDMCKQALDSVKAFFGIASPSKVMRDEVGKMLPAGMAVGIETNADAVTDAMNSVASQTIDVASADVARAQYASGYTSADNSSRLDTLIYLLQEYLPSCAEKTPIDGQSLTNAINRELGMIMV